MVNRVRYACEWTPTGIGIAAQRALSALLAVEAPDIEVVWEPLGEVTYGPESARRAERAEAWLRELRSPRREGETLVHHAVPVDWGKVADAMSPSHQVGHLVLEVDEVPSAWRREMSVIDEFWVPTEWNRRAVSNAFDRPVHVVPHVVSEVQPEPIPLSIPDDVAVVSLVSAWDWRKRPDRAIEAFCSAFSASDDVVLIVKTSSYCVGWPGGDVDVVEMIERLTQQFIDPPRVVIDTGRWTNGQMLGLANRSVCSLSLTSSEGWGLGTFDAASLGVPVIITGFGGHVEFLGDDYPGLVPFRRVRTTHRDRSTFEIGSECAYADLDAAVDLLRAVVNGSAGGLVERAGRLGPELRERYAPRRVGTRLAELVTAIGSR